MTSYNLYFLSNVSNFYYTKVGCKSIGLTNIFKYYSISVCSFVCFPSWEISCPNPLIVLRLEGKGYLKKFVVNFLAISGDSKNSIFRRKPPQNWRPGGQGVPPVIIGLRLCISLLSTGTIIGFSFIWVFWNA